MSKEKEKQTESAAPQGSEPEARATGRPNGRGTVVARRESSAPALGRGDPLAVLRRFAEELDRVFDVFGIGRGLMTAWAFGGRRGLASRGAGLDWATWSPQVEVFRPDDRLVIRADLPGLSRDDVQVEVTDDAVTIRGERRQEHEERREGDFQSERSYGSFLRSIPLPEGVAADQAAANFHDGVLEVTMPAPRRETRRVRRLEVKG